MTADTQYLENVWRKLTPMSSYQGDDQENMRVVSWDQLVQIVHMLEPSQLVNTARYPTPEAAAIRVAAQYFALEDSDILGQSRRSHVSLARKLACRLMRDVGQMSYDSIGHALNRDHTTILYLVRSAEEVVDERPSIKLGYHAMRKALERFIKQQTHGREEEEGQQAVAGDEKRQEATGAGLDR